MSCEPATTSCLAPSCEDARRNGEETDVDCGGECPGCADGGQCVEDGDCSNGACVSNVCQPPRCDDLLQNGSETGIDCGGPACPACPDGSACLAPGDCLSGTCPAGRCVDARCADGQLNQDETEVDCGGVACPPCATCTDGVQNQDEIGLDCGGQSCGPCPTCQDDVRNQDETDVDCGGQSCLRCPTSAGCLTGSDCASGTCSAGICQAASGTCAASADCSCETFGGRDYWFCRLAYTRTAGADHCAAAGMSLVRIDDAAENEWVRATAQARGLFTVANGGVWIGANDVAVDGEWAWPDGQLFWVGDQTGSTVGGAYENWGPLSPRLGQVASCAVLFDTGDWQERACDSQESFACESAACSGCPTCGDALQNQDETAVDCGGATCSPCPDESTCSVPGDCQSSNCSSGTCAPASGGCAETSGCTCDTFGGHQYLLCTNEISRSDAKAQCAAAGMRLIKVEGTQENDWLRFTFSARGMFALGNEPLVWLGGTDAATSGDWLWPDGQLFWSNGAVPGVYENWALREPRGQDNCMGMIDDGTWRRRACNSANVVHACESL